MGAQLREAPVVDTKAHINLQSSIQFYQCPISPQLNRHNIRSTVTIAPVMPFNPSRARELEVLADTNIRHLLIVLVISLLHAIKGHLQDIAADRINALH